MLSISKPLRGFSIMSVTALFLALILPLATAGIGFKASIYPHPGTKFTPKPAFQSFVVQESLSDTPQGFAKVGPAAASSSINLRIALSSKDVPGLEKALLDVSNPSSSNYGNHLSKAEVNAFVAPSDQAVDAVQAWLTSHGLAVDSSSSTGHWISVSVPISKANKMLSANYETFMHMSSGKTYPRTLSFSLPTEVANFIDHIHPTTTFNDPQSQGPALSIAQPASTASSNDTAASCSTAVTPACLQSLYGIPDVAATASSNGIAVAGFIEEFARRADLKHFLKAFRPDMDATTTFTTQKLDGGRNPQNATIAGLEANLDIQYTIGVATGVPVFFVSAGNNFDDGDLEGFLDMVNFLSDQDDVPYVLTTSYNNNEINFSPALAAKLCSAYMALGARGTSVLFSSGDGAVAGTRQQDCTTYQVTFPSGCPYITSVGSTHGIAPEIASAFSSGGFSNSFSIPDYQADAVAAYLKAQGTTNQGLFNASGRGYPDVSAQGENVQIVLSGGTTPVFGTSCSTPIFASIVALLNDQLIAAGKSPLGFLNQWLYSNPDMFNDVTTGSNPGCGAGGFEALAGWDPVTGLGTPNFTKMKAAAGL
ncbi:family S53 protease [Mycena latifolia]|nr:family S53 protease [Mycena latifolia]